MAGTGGRPAPLKVAEHGLPPTADRAGREYAAITADTRPGVVDPAARGWMVAYIRTWLPGLDPTPSADSTCLHTGAPTENSSFTVSGAGLRSPFSGHGPLIGRLAVDLTTGRTATVPEVRCHLAGGRRP